MIIKYVPVADNFVRCGLLVGVHFGTGGFFSTFDIKQINTIGLNTRGSVVAV